MNIYEVHFEDGSTERMTVVFMATEEYRLANGGLSNKQTAIKMAREKYPGRSIKKITRLQHQ